MHFALHLSFTVATGFFHDEPRRLRGLIPGKRARRCSLLDKYKINIIIIIFLLFFFKIRIYNLNPQTQYIYI